MAKVTNVDQLELNLMTRQQYDTATKDPTKLYAVTDAEVVTTEEIWYDSTVATLYIGVPRS